MRRAAAHAAMAQLGLHTVVGHGLAGKKFGRGCRRQKLGRSADYALGPHDDEDLGPPGPHTAQSRPEQPVKGAQLWARLFAFEYGNLLSKGEDLNGGAAPTAEKDSDSGKENNGEFEHELYVVT
jgi:hypothetical protein